MKIPRLVLSVCVLAMLFMHSHAFGAKQAPPFGESLEWNTGSDENPSLDALAGKSVIVMFFQSWCPICNGWSGELFKQVGDAYGDDPKVVLIAIKTDGGDVDDALKYLSSRTDTDKWLVAVDKGGVYQSQALGRNELYQYMWVKPNGEIGEDDGSGSFLTGPGPKRFVIAHSKDAKKYKQGTWKVIPDSVKLDGALDGAVDLAEKGLFLSALAEVSKVSSSAPEEDVAKLRDAIANRVSKSVEKHKLVVEEEESENRYLSLLALEKIVESFGSSAPGVAAKEVVSAHESTSWVADEREAASDYESIMRRAERADDARSRERITKALAKLAEEFPNTTYGRIAASAAKGG
ncbi:MAG: redoxin domain-containing protein [Akkermansiaceae bacterium]|nr:redoxin domain-containing protein [Akkermansiaceae bacterium]